MGITVQFTFDDTWAARIADMVAAFPRAERDEIITALLESLSLTWDDLSPKQKWKVLVLRYTMEELMRHEGSEAAQAASQTVLDDILDNFPLEIGPA